MFELALIIFPGVAFMCGVFAGVSQERHGNTKEASSASANKSIDAILRDIESFCNGRIVLGVNVPAYKDVLYLVRQHINSAKQHNR